MDKLLRNLLIVAFVCMTIGLIVSGCRYIDLAFGTPYNITAKVTDKGIKRRGESDIYLIYTEKPDGEYVVFQVTDNLLAGRFDSSDDYAGIKVGETYEFTVRGKRNKFLTWYPNIYEYVIIRYW